MMAIHCSRFIFALIALCLLKVQVGKCIAVFAQTNSKMQFKYEILKIFLTYSSLPTTTPAWFCYMQLSKQDLHDWPKVST